MTKTVEIAVAESTKIADLQRQLTAEREGRMAAEQIVDEVRARNRELERLIAWRRVGDEAPPAFTTILLWIMGSSLHHDEDYADFGIFNPRTGEFQANYGDDDEVVQVSHWMPEPFAPAKEG